MGAPKARRAERAIFSFFSLKANFLYAIALPFLCANLLLLECNTQF